MPDGDNRLLLEKSGWEPDADGYFFHLAKAARDNGYRALIPIQPGKKACYEVGWPRWRTQWPTDEEIRGWIKKEPNIGFGYAYDTRILGFDLDLTEEAEVQRHVHWLMDHVEGVPMIRIGRPPKVLVVYKAGLGCYGHTAQPEVYWNKGQTVFFGMHPDTKAPYRWQWGSPATRKLNDLPAINGAQVQAFLRHFSGDPNVEYGAGSSSIIRFMKYASDNKVPIAGDVCEDAIRVIACANEGNRHEIIKCSIAYAIYHDQPAHRIEDIMRPAYLKLFSQESMRVQRTRARDFDDLLAWGVKKVVKRAP